MPSPTAFSGFGPEFFGFFSELAQNNEKAWFDANRDRYESAVKAPLAAFVTALAPRMADISANIVCHPKKSVFRIHRDVRFSKDKSPYKTNAGLQFRHMSGKDAHAPGFYLHLEPGTVFYGGGIWKPDPKALGAVRDALASDPDGWREVRSAIAPVFGDLAHGDPISRPPKGFDADHPLIEDIKRRSFFVMRESPAGHAATPGFVDEVASTFAAASPFMDFLTRALGAEF